MKSRKLSLLALTAMSLLAHGAQAASTAKKATHHAPAKASAASASTAAGKKATLWSADDLKWVKNPDHPEISEAVLWGDPRKGAYGAIEKWTAGFAAPLHTHTHDLKSVMVSGTMVITMEGQPEKDLGPGSYVLIPGMAKHTSMCKPGADCIFMHEQAGAFDVTPVAAAAAAK